MEEKKHFGMTSKLEKYQFFFDGEWAEKMNLLTQNSPLNEIAMDLCADWRGIAATSAFPWFMVKNLEDVAQTFVGVQKQLLTGRMRVLLDVIARDFSPSLPAKKRPALRATLDKYRRNVESLSAKPFNVDPGWIWKLHLQTSDFILGIRSSQRVCFGGLYYAYENYVRRVLGLLRGNPDYRIPNDRKGKFKRDFESCFGQDLWKKCVEDKRVEIARLVRNALAHNGGRETDELKSEGHTFPVSGGEIQVTVEYTRPLFNILKGCALALTQGAVRRLSEDLGPRPEDAS